MSNAMSYYFIKWATIYTPQFIALKAYYACYKKINYLVVAGSTIQLSYIWPLSHVPIEELQYN